MSGLEAALDALYEVDPGEFVTTRKQLAAELRAGGDKDGAKQLLGARRPSTAAWALNQLARREPDLVETLLDRARELVAAQTRALSGQADAMRDAIRAHRTALDGATDAALAMLGARANDGFRDEIVSTLRAASTDDDIAGLLRTGRVIREVAASAFPDVGGLTLVPDLVPKPAARRPKAAAAAVVTKGDERAASAERKREAERLREAERAREREAQRRVMLAARDDALTRAAAADAEAASASARVESLRREVAEAELQRDAARERSRSAAAEAARLTREVE